MSIHVVLFKGRLFLQLAISELRSSCFLPVISHSYVAVGFGRFFAGSGWINLQIL